VVVGSALVNCIRDHLVDRVRLPLAVGERVADLAAGVHRH
jgi:hypothetical protein